MKMLLTLVLVFFAGRSQAQDPITLIIKEGIKKVIVAADLRIQRLQNETVWLQNAQKTVENELSRLRLEEIGSWVEKQRQLYADYFDELWRVKAAISYYHRVRDIIQKQKTLIVEYRQAFALFRQDPHFTPQEVQHMQQVYDGILAAGNQNLDALLLVVNAFTTQMPDAARMELIDKAAAAMDRQLADLRQFNNSNRLLSGQRAAERGTLEQFKKWYGL